MRRVRVSEEVRDKMSSLRPVLVSTRSDVQPKPGQKSCPNRFAPQGGRGRDRRARIDGFWLKRNMAGPWGSYVRQAFPSREACAAHFEVAFQTACNWWDDLHAPSAAIYARASLEDGARLHAVMVGGRK